jgi:para-nitrobenzyl esterase
LTEGYGYQTKKVIKQLDLIFIRTIKQRRNQMNRKNTSKFLVLGLILTLGLMIIPVTNALANHGGNLGSHLVDPIWTEGGWVSGTTIDSIYVKGSTYYPEGSEYYKTYEAMLGEIGDKVRIYRGIPYAAPPVGELRWKPPKPVIPWKHIRECTKFAPMAPQSYPASPVYDSIPLEGMSEDVLYLNIQTPAKHANERLPVMVLFHGGGLTIGSVNRVSDNCPPLPQHGVVSVTVQHRIGVFGYMAHPALTAESGYGGSGNYGQMDLIAALKWVKRNIANFGGDPNNVTIWGHSGGGAKTNFLLASPQAKGLFHRAICEAGFSTSATPLATAEGYGLALQAKLVAADIAAMRDKPWKEVLDAVLNPPLVYSSGFTIDNYYMPDTIKNIFTAGLHSDVPYMVGMGGAEISATGTPAMGALLITMSTKQKSPIYTYVFTHVPQNWAAGGVKAYHGLEVSYQYGVVDTVMRMYGVLFSPGPGVPVDPGINQEDYWLQDVVMTMWTNFAAIGDPTPRHGPYRNRLINWDWPKYGASDQFLDIGVPPLIRSGFSLLKTQQPPR